MELTAVKGLKPKTVAALRRARVRTAEDLALVDVHKTKIKGITERQLRALRKRAQREIFRLAAARVRQIAQSTRKVIVEDVRGVETLVRDATVAIMIAARAAEERAVDAVQATEQRTFSLARLAADRARIATRRAEREYRKLVRAVQRAPKTTRTRLRRYVERAEFAKDVANGAERRAAAAVRRARDVVQPRPSRVRSKSLFDRLQRQVRAPFKRRA